MNNLEPTRSTGTVNKMKGSIQMSAEDILANGYDLSRIPYLEAHFERIIKEGVVHGGCWAIMHKGNLIANGSIGARSAFDSSIPMKPDTYFGIASITKLFTTTALMILAEEGKVNLCSPVIECIPEFPFGDVSVWNLLTHTSGLCPDHGCFPDDHVPSYWEFIYNAARIHGADFDWIRTGLSAGKRRETGKEWMYSTFGFTILGEVIARVSGQKAQDFITEKIIKPMGLTHTAYEYTPEIAENIYIWSESQQKELTAVINGESFTDDSEDEKIEQIVRDKLPRTGFGITSTVVDLVKFAQMFLDFGRTMDGKRILGRKIIETVTTEQLLNVPNYCWGAKDPARSHGIGFDMRHDHCYTFSRGTYSHEGSGPSALFIDPKEQLAAAWFAPFVGDDWQSSPLWNVQNIMWSGLI
jgi:CubicO group peptidase (beta-lactamase class C family)